MKSRVAIIAETRYEWYVSYLAVVNGLAVVVPLDKELPANEIVNLMNSAEAITFFLQSEKDAIEGIRDQMPTVKQYINFDLPKEGETDLYFWDILQEGEKARSRDVTYDTLPIDPNEMHILLFTSGTVSKPKGVMLCHHNICTNLRACVRCFTLMKTTGFFLYCPCIIRTSVRAATFVNFIAAVV